MKIKEGYMVREVAGTAVVVPVTADSTFHGMLKLNGTGSFLWEKLTAQTDRESLIAALLAEYEVSEETAAEGVDAFLASLEKLNLLEE